MILFFRNHEGAATRGAEIAQTDSGDSVRLADQADLGRAARECAKVA
jgi:hypothetical protein